MTNLQIANRFFYNNAVSRVQTGIKKTINDTFRTFFFAGLRSNETQEDKVIAYTSSKKFNILGFSDNEEDESKVW